VVVVIVLLLIITILQSEVSAFKQGSFKSMIHSRRTSALNQVSYSATESLKRQMSLYRKQPIAVVVERRRIPPIPVQSVRELESTVKISARSTASKNICRRSGGYPDLEVKDGIYGLLFAALNISMKSKIEEDCMCEEKTAEECACDEKIVESICESC